MATKVTIASITIVSESTIIPDPTLRSPAVNQTRGTTYPATPLSTKSNSTGQNVKNASAIAMTERYFAGNGKNLPNIEMMPNARNP